eukprot:TRINITY_DN7439_c0_g1_i1.p2 TRINITY_DN7439_c0_g1~~TRINITY_DN7439_c0_g1_i1.p2  ORF type:complete len:139 (+),score=31.20 TRINITY_DN7439_c0_g1_i1:273-689(+)
MTKDELIVKVSELRQYETMYRDFMNRAQVARSRRLKFYGIGLVVVILCLTPMFYYVSLELGFGADVPAALVGKWTDGSGTVVEISNKSACTFESGRFSGEGMVVRVQDGDLTVHSEIQMKVESAENGLKINGVEYTKM